MKWIAPLRAGLLLLPALVVSCAPVEPGQGEEPVYPVQGKVFVNDHPAYQALVVLHPLGRSRPDAVRPAGRVGIDGSFTLTTYRPNDGAPAGQYVVTIAWRPSPLAPRPRSPNDEDGEKEEKPADILQGQYSDPAGSPFRVTIGSATNDLAPFMLAIAVATEGPAPP